MKVGNLVTANSTELVTIAQLQPVYVTFAVPAVHLPTIKQHRAPDNAGGRRHAAGRGQPKPVEGQLTFVDNLVDSATDTIKLKATFPNNDLRLWPGQFTRVSLRLTTLVAARRSCRARPCRPVRTASSSSSSSPTPPWSSGRSRSRSAWATTSSSTRASTPGETIVTEGQLRLEQGTRVQASDPNGDAAGRGGRGGGGRGGGGRGQWPGRRWRGRAASAARRRGRPVEPSVNISETFIRRPIATSLLMAAIALFGVVAYRALPISDLPAVEYPTINVGANLPGGDPVTMAASVASPLERQFTTIAGVDEMTSRSGTGNTNVTLTFDLNRNIDSAVTDVQTAISAAMPLLPPTLTAPPSFRKQNPADQPILQINLTSDTLDMTKVDEYAEDILAPRISMVNGVSQVNVQGAAKYAVRVQVDPEKLRGAEDRHQRDRHRAAELERDAADRPAVRAAGHLQHRGARGSSTTRTNSGRSSSRTATAGRCGSTRSPTCSTASSRSRSARGTSRRTSSGAPSRSQVQKQPGTNVIEVADAVRAVLPALEAQLPPSVHLGIRQDRSVNIRQAFSDIQLTMLITLVLVVGVIYLFLHNGSATLIPALALPFSILGTFAVMQVMHYSLDNLSMMALILSVGFVVDDAIVMLENAVRHMEAGESPLEAALKGSKEIGFTIVTMTVSLAAVFIPILFMGGILGRLFREFAVTITTAVLISGARLDHAHADALQPLPARRAREDGVRGAAWIAGSIGCAPATAGACGWCSRIAAVMLVVFVGRDRGDGRDVRHRARRDSFPTPTTTR